MQCTLLSALCPQPTTWCFAPRGLVTWRNLKFQPQTKWAKVSHTFILFFSNFLLLAGGQPCSFFVRGVGGLVY